MKEKKQVVLTENELRRLLLQLMEWNALELCPLEGTDTVMIPYVMNDAVECYLQLEECTVQGSLENNVLNNQNSNEDTDILLTDNQTRKGMILRQGNGNIVTIWYKKAIRILHLYQYHMIGHAWRREKGEEDLRRLVNLLCVLHDKRNYLGEDCCSEKELWLANLAEFAPVRYFTPINESILDWYEDSEAGIQSALHIARTVGDQILEEKLIHYAEAYKKKKCSMRKIKMIAKLLREDAHREFWNMIRQEIEQASLQLEARSYGAEEDTGIQNRRERLVRTYQEAGYEGSYPKMRYCHVGEPEREICFVEEQPFTVMEEKDFVYRFYSIRYIEGTSGCRWQEEG